jgi:hypothetical protein
VVFTPPGEFAAAAYHSVLVSAGDDEWVEDPPPARAHMMRDVRIGFTTVGHGRPPWEVDNRGFDDGRTQPPTMAFAVRGTATSSGELLLGHHFALLDSNSSHKHNAVFIHRPDVGNPHVVVGWTGSVFGFSGMNDQGLAYTVNLSDTLDNPLADEFRTLLFFAKLVSSGIPAGMLGREILTHTSTVQEALDFLRTRRFTYGWNFLLGDAQADMALLEVDANIEGDATSFHVITPDTSDASNLDPWGRPYASVGPDDLRTNIHFTRNQQDIVMDIMGYQIYPQRYWTSYFFRSVRSFYILGDEISQRYGTIDVLEAQALLSIAELIDERDSMNAVVLEPERRRIYFALGEVPATDAPWVELDLGAWLAQGGP